MKWDAIDPEVIAFGRDQNPGKTLAGKPLASASELPSRRNVISLFYHYRRPITAVAACILVFATVTVSGMRLSAYRQAQHVLRTIENGDKAYALSSLLANPPAFHATTQASLRSIAEEQLQVLDRVLKLQGDDPKIQLAKAQAYVATARFLPLLGGEENNEAALADLHRATEIKGSLASIPGKLDVDIRLATAYVITNIINMLTPVDFGSQLPIIKNNIGERLMPDLDQVIALPDTDARLRAAKASAYIDRAKLRHLQGNDSAAFTDLDLATNLRDNIPASIERDMISAAVNLTKVLIFGQKGNFKDAAATVSEIIPVLEADVKSQPERYDANFNLALAYNGRANCRRELAQQNDAITDYRAAISITKSLLGNGIDDARIIEWQSRLYSNLGLLLLERAKSIDSPDAKEAQKDLQIAVEMAERLLDRFPKSRTCRDALTVAVLNQGVGQAAMEQFPAAEKSLYRAVQFYHSLHEDYPEIQDFVWGQAFALSTLGQFLLDPKLSGQRKTDAIPWLRDAYEKYEELTRIYPDNTAMKKEFGLLKQSMKLNGINP